MFRSKMKVALLACLISLTACSSKPSSSTNQSPSVPINPGLSKDLLIAAEKGDASALQDLLAKGADVNARDVRGKTVLMMAAESGHSAIVETLLARGANVNANDASGGTALMAAAEGGHAAIVDALLAKGADTNSKG